MRVCVCVKSGFLKMIVSEIKRRQGLNERNKQGQGNKHIEVERKDTVCKHVTIIFVQWCRIKKIVQST